jgi:amino acid transporter/mannitol/fructose-specific phosphotransferase system IIA component (Ntr-type)
MISSGLFVLPGPAFAEAGPAVVLAYAVAALMVIPALLSKAELATAMPKSGGDYFFVERSMGALPGMLAGLATWFSLALKSAFAMIGIGAFAQLIWPHTGLKPWQWEWLVKGVAILCCLVFTAMNVLSVRFTGAAQIVMVGALLVVLAVFVVSGVPNVRQHPNFDNFMGEGVGSLFATAALVFVSFGGLTKIASVAEEIRNPARNIPRAMFLAYIVVTLLYVAAVFVVVGVVPAEELAGGPARPYGDLTPLSTAAGRFLGRAGLIVLSVAAMLAFVTTGNSGILSASRNPMAMSRDGLLPRGLRRLHRRFETPYVSILLTGAFMVAMIAALSIRDLVKVASTMKLILFLLINVAVLVMRGSRLQNYRPSFRCPMFPWVQVAGVVLYAALIVALTAVAGPAPLLTSAAFVAAGLLWYLFYVRRRTDRESALVYMVRKAVDRQIGRSKLEEELREIALERDEVVHDRFDRLVKECEILDLSDGTTPEDMFALAADLLGTRLGIEKAELLRKFQQREAASSTVIRPGLAIPHVIVDGEGLFDLMVVRCRGGIRFKGHAEPVQTAFILIGSPDERNYHLRALMAIAHIVQEHGFTRRWLAAPHAEHLRDILLLSGRERDKET